MSESEKIARWCDKRVLFNGQVYGQVLGWGRPECWVTSDSGTVDMQLKLFQYNIEELLDVFSMDHVDIFIGNHTHDSLNLALRSKILKIIDEENRYVD